MAADGQVVFEISADGKKAMASIDDVTEALKKAGKNWESEAGKSTSSIADKFTGMFKKISVAALALKAGKALLDFGKDAIQAASDLEEVQNVVDVTFGEGNRKIEDWAKNASAQFGLTELQAKKFTSTLGAMMKSSGLAGDQIETMSTDLAGLAADMASFYNLDFETAFSKIRSGLSGMTMPLKELGIDMSVDTMNAFALSQGLEKTFAQMSQAEQTVLRYQYLMQATADAQGDFARTSDGLANTQRRLETAIDTLKTKLGEPFLDVVADATNALANFVSALIPDEKKSTVLDDLNNAKIEKDQKLADIKAIMDQVTLLLSSIEKINTEQGLNPDSDVVGFVGAFVDKLNGLDTATQNAETIESNLNKIANGLSAELGGDPTKWKNLLTAIKNNAKGAIDATQGDSEKTKQFLENVASGAKDLSTDYSGYWSKLLGVLGSNAETTINALTNGDVAGTALENIASGANALGMTTASKWSSFVEALNGIGGSDGSNLQSIANALSTNLSGDASKWENLLKAIGNNAKAAIDAIGDNDGSKTKEFLASVAESADDLSTDYSPYWTSLLKALGDNAATAIGALAGGEAAGTSLASIASGANDLERLAGTRWKSFVDALGGLAGRSDISKNLNDVAKALSRNVGGKAADWETLLTAVGNNLGKVSEEVINDKGQTAAFLEAAAAAADDLGGDYSTLWGKLLSTLGTDAGAAVAALKDATSTGDNLSKIASGANALTAGKQAMWSSLLSTLTKVDGLKNIFDSTSAGNVEALAKALSGNSPDVSQAEAWKIFLDALGTNPEALTVLTQVNADETAAWLSTMSDAVNSIDPSDAQAWSNLLATFVGDLPGLNNTQYGEAFFEAMKNNFLAMGSESDVAALGLKSLGYSTQDITDMQAEWLVMMNDLVKTVPGLSSVINTQTGEIKGGTQAVKDYMDEWEKAQTKQAYLEEYAKMRQALNDRYADRYSKQIDVWYAESHVEDLRRQQRELEAELKEMYGENVLERLDTGEVPIKEMQRWEALDNELYDAEEDLAAKQQELNTYMGNYSEALAVVEEKGDLILKQFGATAKEEAEASATTKELAKEMTTLEKAAAADEGALADVEKAVKTMETAMKELADYQEKIRTETESSVEGVIHDFAEVISPMTKARNELKKWNAELSDQSTTKERREELEKLIEAAKKTENAGPSFQNMQSALDSQLKFMQQYNDELAAARANGVSDQILASLSNGSTESYDYLYALNHTLEGLSDDEKRKKIQELNDTYAEVQKTAEEFTNTLTDQKLAADEEYQTLVDKAKDAVAGLNMGETAYDNVSQTLQGIIDACGDKSEAIKSAVDSIYEQMLRLSSVGAGAWFDTGKLTFRNSSVFSYGTQSHANGMDYVPYDGYLALLHQGERIQTAAEADLARRYSYQQPGFDYSAMGGAIGANIGRGNVYLDGRTVGTILSDRQANSYRAMERSGWQG